MLCSDCGKEVRVRVMLEVEENTMVGILNKPVPICLPCLKKRLEET